jgi:hypothetical protein
MSEALNCYGSHPVAPYFCRKCGTRMTFHITTNAYICDNCERTPA